MAEWVCADLVMNSHRTELVLSELTNVQNEPPSVIFGFSSDCNEVKIFKHCFILG